MGVCCIVQWAYPDTLNTSQALEMLQKRIEVLGGTNIGTWSVDCDVFQSTAAAGANSQNKSIYLIHSTEYPRSTFTIVDPPYICLVADNTLDIVFNHLRPFYAPRKPLKVEVKGTRYEVNNKFIIKFGSVTFSNTKNKNENTVSTAWDSLTELTKSLLYTPVHIAIPDHVQNSLDGCYTPADSMVQYAQIFNHIRKSGGK